MKIQPFKKGRTNSSSRDSLSRGVSLDKAGGESVSALMDEEYADEVASFTDDDVSSHSSQTMSSSLEANRGLSPLKAVVIIPLLFINSVLDANLSFRLLYCIVFTLYWSCAWYGFIP
jgi:hypothetical protein